MNRFLLFAGDQYYPLGGWQDFKGSFHKKEDALAEAARLRVDWYQVVDQTTGQVVVERPEAK